MTATLTTHLEIEIPRPPDAVWAVVSDYPTDTIWRKGITEMSADRSGPPSVGTKVHEVLELAGKTYVTDTAVTEVGPGLSYRFAGAGTSGVVRGGREVAPKGAGSLFTYHVEVEPTEMPRAMRPILGWWLRRSMRKDLRRLRAMIESAP